MTGKWFPVALLAISMAACDESPVTLPDLPEATAFASTAAELRLTVGDVATIPAQVVDQNGRVMNDARVAFSSDNPSVVSVDANGTVRAVSPGTANVTATFGKVTATTKVTVSRDERNFVRTLDVMADSVVTDVRNQTPTIVTLRAFTGFGEATCPNNLIIQSSDPSVASAVSLNNCQIRVFPQFTGRTTITVSADGVTDQFTVIVSSVGARAFFLTRPTAEQTFAGNTVTYSVRVVDEQGNSVANRTVNFDVTAGRLDRTTAVTDVNGIATVQWTLPTALRDVGGEFSTISFRTTLPNGAVAGGSETVRVVAAAPTSITFFRSDNFGSGFTEISGTSITAQTFRTVYLGARGEDQFGNPADFTFTVTAPARRVCGDNRSFDGEIEFTCISSFTTGTSTFTATSQGVSRSMTVNFIP